MVPGIICGLVSWAYSGPSSVHWLILAPGRLVCVGAKGKAPQDKPLWHANYFKLKTIKAQKTPEESLTFPLTT